MAVLVERRLRAMEDYFVQSLRQSYEFHQPLRVRNAEDMGAFQNDVVDAASSALAAKLLDANGAQLPAWLQEALTPHVSEVEEELRAAADREAAAAAAAAESTKEESGEMEEEVEENDDMDDGDGEVDEDGEEE
ncbi:putative delta-1-pyrroline-5-carboxylate dehydrogenase, partial [Trypanosoma grayi]|uniref:putative delta-1-pyrroline-5-carboxylate dehydrogenase n=1 Tax=Trypanosoma grayi TaxID=71804 RepID=UPI0004F4830F